VARVLDYLDRRVLAERQHIENEIMKRIDRLRSEAICFSPIFNREINRSNIEELILVWSMTKLTPLKPQRTQ